MTLTMPSKVTLLHNAPLKILQLLKQLMKHFSQKCLVFRNILLV